MSKLIEQLKSRDFVNTRQAKCVQVKFDVKDANDVFGKVKHPLGDYVHNLSVTIGANMVLKHQDMSDDKLLYAKNILAKRVIEELFGEFRKDFIDIQEALHMYDIDEAIKRLNTFENKMFRI